MDRFVSNLTTRSDSKRWVSIPAPIPAVLARDEFEESYADPALDALALDAGGNALPTGIEVRLSTLSPYSDTNTPLGARTR